MKKLVNALVLMLAIVTALTGCGRKLRYRACYTLDLPAPPAPAAPKSVRTSIAVREFQSPVDPGKEKADGYRTTPRKSDSTNTTAGPRIRARS